MGVLGKTEKSFSDSSKPIFFNFFLLSQTQRETSFSTFNVITSAVAWAHKKLGLQSPTESAMTIKNNWLELVRESWVVQKQRENTLQR